MYSINSKGWGQIREEEVDQFQRDMAIHEHVYGLGNYATIFTRADEFRNRVLEALKGKGYNYRMGLVQHYDSATTNGFLEEPKWGFQKRDEYSFLNEYRLLIDDPISKDDMPFRFNIGSLKDISLVVPSGYLKDALKVKARK